MRSLFICVLFDFFFVFITDFSLLLQRPSVLAWMEQSVQKIVSEQKNVAAFTFTCRLLALLTENVEQFVQLNQHNIYSKYGFRVYADAQPRSKYLPFILIFFLAD